MTGLNGYRLSLAALAIVAVAAVACAQSPMDSISKLPGNQVENDTQPRVTPERLAPLPPAVRASWESYLDRSRRALALDTALMNAELRTLGRTVMTRAPNALQSFMLESWMTDAWMQGADARQLAEVILSYQTPSGGWSKHVDFTQGPRATGQSFFSENEQWHYIATIDNNSTTSQMTFLARLDAAQPDARYRAAFLRAVSYLLDAQFPNGCWPQVYPMEGGYHDNATFNDDAIVNVATILQAVGAGQPAFVPGALRQSATAAAGHAVDCMLAAQTRVGGTLTIWPQQADPLSLEPADARSYEHRSLTAKESVPVLLFLMALDTPDPSVVAAVHAASDYLERTKIMGIAYDNQVETKVPGAGPIWARMYEIGTDRPIFSNRDGIVLYEWNKLTDRRSGYAWYTDAPLAFRAQYPAWAQRHPRGAR
jgi:PelA/Pel-15E family pectate lyase